MYRVPIQLFCFLFFCSIINAQEFTGFFSFTYDDESGDIVMEVPANMLGEEFLYVPSLSAGVGSNDIGLDRGQLGGEKVVRIDRRGKKLFLTQPNLDYRANSSNSLEVQAVKEAFAESVIWGWEIKEKKGENYIVSMTDFLLRDVHGVISRLKRAKQGNFKLDKSRSAINIDRTKAFPNNTEFDVILTFTGQADGRYLQSVTPDNGAVTVQQHHSFVRLPDEGYEPRAFHPYSGYFSISYYDYATPIESPLEKRWITRHRLEKRNPEAPISEAKEPIVYYMDPGCPEPVRSALMEGAAWWDQAYQAAGYAPGTFQIKDLPAGADMMDVRYNVIQWVHRSTRGWSYGASVIDPRTGEIIKGHVSLGSLRVRQDFLIAQGLLSPYGDDDSNHEQMMEAALARLRQLAAHEVGHTIGLSHNFASSVNDRASVMDYPHPYVELTSNGTMDYSQVYDDKIGAWDKQAIIYGYADLGSEEEATPFLNESISKAQGQGLQFISDQDARPIGGAHPQAHLWDNRPDAADELNRMMKVRANALKRFGEATITTGTPLSELEKVLVPLYLMHRYQLEATVKMIGGLDYGYYVKGDALDHRVTPVEISVQDKAIRSILNTLTAKQLKLPTSIIELIPPPAMGYPRDRETFSGKTNVAFDPLGPVQSYVDAAFGMMLHGDRLARIHRHSTAHGHPMTLSLFLDQLADYLFEQESIDAYSRSIEDIVKHGFVQHLLSKLANADTDLAVAVTVQDVLQTMQSQHLSEDIPLYNRLRLLIEEGIEEPGSIVLPEVSDLPPGSPIGCMGHFGSSH
ncbi:MAG: zinc-dependent metalloprotease [Bacteroidota bacterium]